MSGSGYRTFAAGEYLTADNVQGYLMKQAIIHCADYSAVSALSAEKGFHALALDTRIEYVFDGTTWRPWASPNILFTPSMYADSSAITHGTGAGQQGYYSWAGGSVTITAKIVLGTSPSIAACTALGLGLPTGSGFPAASALLAWPCVGTVSIKNGSRYSMSSRLITSADGSKITAYVASGAYTSTPGYWASETLLDENLLGTAAASGDTFYWSCTVPMWV